MVPGSGRSPGEGNGNPLHYPCLENPTDKGAWRATVHEVANSWTRLSNYAHILIITTVTVRGVGGYFGGDGYVYRLDGSDGLTGIYLSLDPLNCIH